MTYLFNDPTNFADEAAAGFVAANAHLVRRVRGGVVRARRAAPGTVSVVIGGGSGHYPAFAGLVGCGLAAGAAMGNLFASPSAQQAYSVAKAADAGGGILFSYGNYSGDVLNFDQAQGRLVDEGIPCATVVVTDDVSSSPASASAKRRGIAGGLVVYKVAGAAADSGATLAEVARLAALANDRTRSIGVAFSGCTLPGARGPLFTVPPGRMAIGMGVHGEPGVGETDVPTADQLAELIVSTLLGELPDGVTPAGARVALILNGLGSVKYEELFVVYGRVSSLLCELGTTIVDPEVGELVTSFAMAGASLTLCWLDDELEQLWRAPALAPAFRKAGTAGHLDPVGAGSPDPVEGALPAGEPTVVAEATPQSRAAAGALVRALEAARAAIEEAVDQLGRYDAVAGDGDHGIGMQRGITAAVSAARRARELGAGAGTVAIAAGDAWADRGGGTSGALWGIALRSFGASIGDTDAVGISVVARAVRRAREEIERFGKAHVGDKTMLDALAPFAAALDEAAGRGDALATGWSAAARAASRAADETATLVARIGRSRLHEARSVGTPDPGAVSFALVVGAVQHAMEARDAIEERGEHG